LETLLRLIKGKFKGSYWRVKSSTLAYRSSWFKSSPTKVLPERPSVSKSTAYTGEHAGWAEGSCASSRRFHEAVLQVIVPPAGTPALCHHGRSGYQPFSLFPNPYGVVVCKV
jgi:hypothetical protein